MNLDFSRINKDELLSMFSKEDLMEMVDLTKLTNFVNKLRGREVVVVEKKTFDWKKLFVVLGVIAAIAGAAYALYRYFSQDYEDEFLDDFEDEDDDLFEDDLDEEEETEEE